MAIGGLFLAQWVVLDQKFDDIWYGGAFSLATIFVLLTSPFFGAWSDRSGRRLPFVKWLTLLMLISSGLLALVAPSTLPHISRIILVLIIACFVQYFYQLSLIFYNTLLEKLTSSDTRGKVSGWGEAVNNLGWILAAAVLLLFANGKISLWGEPGRAQVFLPAFLLATILSLPLLLWFKESTHRTITSAIDLKAVYHKTISGFKELFSKQKNVGLFLVGFSFVADGVQTFNLYFAIIMDRFYKIVDSQKFTILLVHMLSSALFSYLLGKLSDRYNPKTIFLLSCWVLVVSISIALLFTQPAVLYLVGFLTGVGWGGFYSVSRSLLIKISPATSLGEYFGFYSTFQRFASVIGPLTWGAVTLGFRNLGDTKYQIAGFTMVGLALIGILVTSKAKV